MMTVEKFNSTERLPYIDFDAIDYDGNCYTYGKWNGTEVAFSNISFLTGISEKMKIRFYIESVVESLDVHRLLRLLYRGFGSHRENAGDHSVQSSTV